MIRMLCVVRARKGLDPDQLLRALNDDAIAAVFRGLQPMTEAEWMGYDPVVVGQLSYRGPLITNEIGK